MRRFAPSLESFFYALLAVGALGASLCGVGLLLALPAFAILVERTLVTAERHADDMPTRSGRTALFSSGASAFVCVAVTFVAAGAAASAVGITLTEAYGRLPSWGPLAVALSAIVAAPLLAAAFAPLAYVPFAAADRRLGLFAAIVRGLEIAARDRRGALSVSAAVAALILVVPPTVLGVLAVYLREEDSLGILAAVAAVPALAVSTTVIANRYVSVRRNAPPPDAARRLPPVVRASFAIMPLAAALVLGSAGWAMATPSTAPLDASIVDGARHEVLAISASDDVTIPHTFVRLRASDRALTISTPDGGGAGRIVCPALVALPDSVMVQRDGDELRLHVIGVTRGAAGPYACVIRASRSGVRLDDDLLDRLARGSWLFPLGAWLAFFGFLWLVTDAVRHAIDARILAAADLSREDAGGGLRALEGVVVGRDGAQHLEAGGGELRFALPRRRGFADGATITVLARFTGALGLGTREGPRALPRGARVVLGGVEAARTFLAEQASRSAIVATLIVIGGSVFAAVSLLVPLIRGG